MSKRRFVSVAAAVMVVFAASLTAVPAAASEDDAMLQNVANSMCADYSGTGDRITFAACDPGKPSQRWWFEPNVYDPGYYVLHHRISGRCIVTPFGEDPYPRLNPCEIFLRSHSWVVSDVNSQPFWLQSRVNGKLLGSGASSPNVLLGHFATAAQGLWGT